MKKETARGLQKIAEILRAGHIWQLRNEKIGNAADCSIYRVSIFKFQFSSFQSCASLHFSRLSHYLILNVLPLAFCEAGLCGSSVSISSPGHFNPRHPILYLDDIYNIINVGVLSQQSSWRGQSELFLHFILFQWKLCWCCCYVSTKHRVFEQVGTFKLVFGCIQTDFSE